MSLTCFDDLIGIRGECGTPSTPDSGVYVQDLTELHMKNYDKSTSQESKSGFEAIKDLMSYAAKEIAHDFRVGFNNRFDAKSIIENDIVGHWKQNLTTKTDEPTYLRGIHVQVDTDSYTSFFLSEVSLHSQTTGNVTVEVWDLTQNKKLDDIVVSCTAGEVATTQVYKSYTAKKQKLDLFIGATDSVYETNISPKHCCGNRHYKNGTARFYGSKILTADNKIVQNLSNSTGTSGVSLTYSVSCDFDQWMCSQRHMMVIPYLYKIGEKSMMDYKYSKRINSIVTLHRQDHQELIDYYRSKYEMTMTDVFENMVLPKNRCFHCRKQARTAVALP